MLSDELLQELQSEYGTNANDLVFTESTSAKKKQKLQQKQLKEATPSEEVKQIVKKLSKKKQKRVDQILKRKERDLKHNDYIQIINKNALDETKRELLTSTRALNQQLSLKQLLSLLIKKEKAGIPLTEEEMDVLYKRRGEVDDEDMMEDLSPKITNPFITDATLDTAEVTQTPSEIDAPFLFEDILKSAKSSELSSDGLKEKKKGKKRKHTDDNPVSETDAINVKPINHLDSPTISNLSVEISESEKSLVDESQSIGKQNRLINPVMKCKRRKPLRSLSKESEFTFEGPIIANNEVTAQNPQKQKMVAESTPEITVKSEEKKSLGALMLEKFKKLKEKTEDKVEKVTMIDFNTENTPTETFSDRPAKTFEELKLPLDKFGRIEPTTGKSLSTSSEQKADLHRSNHHVNRPADIRTARMNLPVCQMEQEIVEAVIQNDVIILCGETGSGKSTQVPQFLYEYGYADDGMIGIAQPRRVAVISTADRVNYEMGQKTLTESERLVGYQVRYDSHTITPKTKVKFMTDGILLREITQDILLRQYSIILLDEAHERNVNTDILLGMLSKAIPLRHQISEDEQKKYQQLSEAERAQYSPPIKPLKLIIMSATIRVTDFQSSVLFPKALPPVISVPARQYPVVSHFAKRTEIKDYLQETYRKVVQIHNKLPAGGILVFLTGKHEILSMCRRLYQRFYGKKLSEKTSGSNKSKKNKRKRGQSEENVDEEVEGEDIMKIIDDELNVEEDQMKLRNNTELSADELMAEYLVDEDHGNGEEDGEDGELDEAVFQESDEEGDDDDDYSVTDPLNPNYNSSTQSVQPSTIAPPKLKLDASDGDDETRRMMLAKLLGKDYQPTVQQDSSSLEHNVSNSINTSTVNVASVENIAEDAQQALKPLIYPLYAMMSPKLQERVFRPVPEGYRLIVIATNVAETSITIPNITYVVDSGRCKEKVNVAGPGGSAGVTKYEINWVSKASADQRQGRAGRTGPGHCYRLYSANFYHQYMKSFQPPEITVTPLEDVILQMAALGIKQLYHFPFPTNPPKHLISNAIKLLQNLNALIPQSISSTSSNSNLPSYMQFIHDKDTSASDIILAATKKKEMSESHVGNLSVAGRLMSFFPIHPRFSKILVTAIFSFCIEPLSSSLKRNNVQSILDNFVRYMGFALSLVAALTEKSIFVHRESFDQIQNSDIDDSDDEDAGKMSDDSDFEKDDEEDKDKKKNSLFRHPSGDSLALLRGTEEYSSTVLSLLRSQAKDNSVVPVLNKRSLQKLMHSSAPADVTKALEGFCSSFQLHQMTLHRILDLRCQLQQITEQLLPKLLKSFHLIDLESSFADLQAKLSSVSFPSPSVPPTIMEEAILRQVLLSGYCDQIAKKIPIGMMKSGNRRDRFTGYVSCHPMFYTKEMIVKQKEKQLQQQSTAVIRNVKTEEVIVPIYIHPHSNLYPANPLSKLPQYVIYHSIVMNQSQTKYYMTNVTIIEESWIINIAKDSPLLSYGDILTSPTPSYDSREDIIFCHVTPKYGHPEMTQSWELSTVRKPMIEILVKKFGHIYSSSSAPVSFDSATAGLLGYRKEDEIYR